MLSQKMEEAPRNWKAALKAEVMDEPIKSKGSNIFRGAVKEITEAAQ